MCIFQLLCHLQHLQCQKLLLLNPVTDSGLPQEEFRLVSIGVRPKTKSIIALTTFHIHSGPNDDDNTEKIRFVGDSMVRYQLIEFCGIAPRTRKCFCIPGVGVNDVITTSYEMANLAPENMTCGIHGTNEVQRTWTEDDTSQTGNFS